MRYSQTNAALALYSILSYYIALQCMAKSWICIPGGQATLPHITLTVNHSSTAEKARCLMISSSSFEIVQPFTLQVWANIYVWHVNSHRSTQYSLGVLLVLYTPTATNSLLNCTLSPAVTIIEHYRGSKRVIKSDLDLERDVGSFEPALF